VIPGQTTPEVPGVPGLVQNAPNLTESHQISPKVAGHARKVSSGDKVPMLVLSGAIIPDTIIGMINGAIITDTPFVTVEMPEYKSIRFLSGTQLIEIRYAEAVMSRMREICLMQMVLGAIEWNKRLDRTAKKVLTIPRRKSRDGSGSSRDSGKNKEPKITLLELEKIYQSRK